MPTTVLAVNTVAPGDGGPDRKAEEWGGLTAALHLLIQLPANQREACKYLHSQTHTHTHTHTHIDTHIPRDTHTHTHTAVVLQFFSIALAVFHSLLTFSKQLTHSSSHTAAHTYPADSHTAAHTQTAHIHSRHSHTHSSHCCGFTVFLDCFGTFFHSLLTFSKQLTHSSSHTTAHTQQLTHSSSHTAAHTQQLTHGSSHTAAHTQQLTHPTALNRS